jgi:hypothetical protein
MGFVKDWYCEGAKYTGEYHRTQNWYISVHDNEFWLDYSEYALKEVAPYYLVGKYERDENKMLHLTYDGSKMNWRGDTMVFTCT